MGQQRIVIVEQNYPFPASGFEEGIDIGRLPQPRPIAAVSQGNTLGIGDCLGETSAVVIRGIVTDQYFKGPVALCETGKNCFPQQKRPIAARNTY